MDNRESHAIELLDQCIEKAAQDYLDGKSVDTRSIQALAGAINVILMYDKYREDKVALRSLTEACELIATPPSQTAPGVPDNHCEDHRPLT